jgi:hypothetical protein
VWGGGAVPVPAGTAAVLVAGRVARLWARDVGGEAPKKLPLTFHPTSTQTRISKTEERLTDKKRLYHKAELI